MSVYRSSLLGRTRVADGTMAFQFERPRHFHFKPGQYVYLTIPDPEVGSRITHAFSIASSPLSQDLLVTTPHAKHTFQEDGNSRMQHSSMISGS